MKNVLLKVNLVAFLVGFIINQNYAHDPSKWTKATIGANPRQWNAVQVLDTNTIVIAGGNESNDSITAIYRSTDRGVSWNIVLDIPFQPWLKGMYFVNSSVGFAVGYEGLILKTTDGGQNWTPQTAPGNAATRDFNGVYFVDAQVGYIAGGNRSNDSIQTILKTTDGGANWSIQRDGLGYWLKSIFFASPDTGFAAGEHGTALMTTDGGNNWNQMTLPGNATTRTFNSIYFMNSSTGFLVGGNESNDSIQTILKTTDGGNNWNLLRDNIAPWLKSVYFSSSTEGFAVGDDGDFQITQDGGDTWSPIGIPDTVNDDGGLNAVDFLNPYFGVAVGWNDKVLIYYETAPPVAQSPTVETGYATEISPNNNSATLNGTVNANGSSSAVVFEYGTTPSLGNTMVATPDTVAGNTTMDVSADISGLSSNTLYYFRVKAQNANGQSFGVVKQFYIGDNPIPNFDFELWDSVTVNTLDDWVSLGGVIQVPSYDGSLAVGLQFDPSQGIGAILFGMPDNNGVTGGTPFAARPDSLVGYFNYDIAANDSAVLLLFFKKGGNINSQQFYYITGSSSGNFERLSFPISYSNGDVPDSVIVGIVNSNPFSSTSPNPNSYLEVDNISFAGTSENVPNNDFEAWSSSFFESPTSWLSVSDIESTVAKTNDSQHGDFAIRLENNPNNGQVAGVITNDPNVPGFAVNVRHNTLNGYFKFLPDNADTMMISVVMYENGQNVGGGTLNIDTMVSGYTPFEVPIFYNNPGVMPDSANIFLLASSSAPQGTSVLFVDNLSFDGFYAEDTTVIDDTTGVLDVFGKDFTWKVYPNPADNNVTLQFTSQQQGTATLRIVDLSGKQAYATEVDMPGQHGQVNLTVSLDNMQSGFYFVVLQGQNGVRARKLIIAH